MITPDRETFFARAQCGNLNRRYRDQMRAANITASIAASLWFGLVLMGWALEDGVAGRMGGNVNIGQFNFYVVWPALVVMALLACAWVCNLLRRWSGFLGLVAGTSLLALLPFLFVYTGGM